MRVWSNNPKLITGIGNKPLYGYLLGFPPTSIYYKDFLVNKKILVEAPFTTEFLRERFPINNIPENLRFTLSELRFMSFIYIKKLAISLGITDKIRKKGLIFKIREKLKDL